MRGWMVGIVLLVIVAAMAGCSYNRLVAQEEAVKGQWAQVENQLQRRNDLIPNLVATAKGFASHEQAAIQAVADSRAKLAGAQTPEQTIAAANEQSSALARLLVIVENYPQLKANEQFNRLMDELAGTENRIGTERTRYNEQVQVYNTPAPALPVQPHGGDLRLQGIPVLPGAPRSQAGPQGGLRALVSSWQLAADSRQCDPLPAAS